MEQEAQARDRLAPTWVPDALEQWCAPGGPLHETGTLAELCSDWSVGSLGADALDAAVTTRASEMESLGVRGGEAVAWQLPNCTESVVMYRACWEMGAVAAPMHHLAGRSDLEAMLSSLSPVAFLATDGHLERRGDRREGADEGLVDHPAAPARMPTSPADIAVVLHTSGTSGRPKGVMHTHRALAYKARSMAQIHGLGPSDAVLMPAPLAHVSGLLNGILVPAAANMRTVLMARWDPGEALGLIESERITFMVGPPTFFTGLEQSEDFSPARVESLRVLSVGGAGVTPEFVERASQLFGAEVKRSYGSTEAPTVASSPAGEDPWTMSHTDGRPTGVVRIRTVEPSSREQTPKGVPGEVELSGPELFCGYSDPGRNESVISGDWLRTGDLGILDDEGRLTITGRVADVIVRGGENIAAAEVEAHLLAHPDVAAAVVVGEPDERLGERAVAIVELTAAAEPFGLEACRAWFEFRGAARFKTPERIVVLEHLPLLASGKADRAAVQRSMQRG